MHYGPGVLYAISGVLSESVTGNSVMMRASALTLLPPGSRWASLMLLCNNRDPAKKQEDAKKHDKEHRLDICNSSIRDADQGLASDIHYRISENFKMAAKYDEHLVRSIRSLFLPWIDFREFRELEASARDAAALRSDSNDSTLVEALSQIVEIIRSKWGQYLSTDEIWSEYRATHGVEEGEEEDEEESLKTAVFTDLIRLGQREGTGISLEMNAFTEQYEFAFNWGRCIHSRVIQLLLVYANPDGTLSLSQLTSLYEDEFGSSLSADLSLECAAAEAVTLTDYLARDASILVKPSGASYTLSLSRVVDIPDAAASEVDDGEDIFDGDIQSLLDQIGENERGNPSSSSAIAAAAAAAESAVDIETDQANRLTMVTDLYQQILWILHDAYSKVTAISITISIC
jgi:hypothetical protein